MDDSGIFEPLSHASVADVTLVVDLDGSLIKTDMLYETAWSALSRRWINVVPMLRKLMQGRAPLKRYLEQTGPVDVTLLPYNADVIAYVTEWRRKGGRTALVSASDQKIVTRVADHLGLFDEAHGSDGKDNLKGPAKAARLEALYGPGRYAYIGDSTADLAVWRGAVQAITVGISAPLQAQVERDNREVLHLSPRDSHLRPLLKAMRPHQWLKNVLVFLPLMTAHQFNVLTFGQALMAFVAYSLIASSVYLLNDLLDLDADRQHARKCKRPFASGDLPLAWGTMLAPGLLAAGFAIAFLLGPPFAAVMGFYYVVTTLYSFLLKRRLLVDICALAGLYTLRIIAGGMATGIPLSVWLLAFSMFFFFALAAIKRQAELVAEGDSTNKTVAGRDYRPSDKPLVANMAVASGYMSVLVMALYLDSPAVRALYAYPEALWGICLVLLFWISRMVMITHRGWMHDDPVVFAAKDYISIVCLGLIFMFALGGMLL